MTTSISLLPQSPQGMLLCPSDRLRILTLKKILIDEAISALEDFLIYRRASAFDGHIGETSCQIRAYHIYLLILTQKNNVDILYELEELKHLSARIATVIIQYQANTHKKEKPQTIIDFFQEKNLSCTLSELSAYLTQLHLLSSFKTSVNNGDLIINYQEMCKTLKIFKHTARKIVHIYQVNISQLSCNFIQSLMLQTCNALSEHIFNSLIKIDEDGRYALPCYWIIHVLYAAMLKQKCPILIISERYFKNEYMDTIQFVFKVSSDGKDYEYCPLNDALKKDLY